MRLKHPVLRSVVFCLSSAALPAYTSLVAQAPKQPAPPILIESVDGRDLFSTYCAGCHGHEGKGDGSVARLLKARPTDLTMLARRNGGTYPASLVEATLNGTRRLSLTTAHGTIDMPVWGTIFQRLNVTESVTNLRIQNLVKYIESIQLR